MNMFQKRADLIDRYTSRFNPLRGLDVPRVARILEAAEEGFYAELQWLNRLVEKRDAVIRAVRRRHVNALRKLDWSIEKADPIPEGATEAQADEQVRFLNSRYDAVDNVQEALEFLAGADFRGFSHLEIHRGVDGFPTHLEPVPQWHWCREGLYGTWRYNAGADLRPQSKTLPEIDGGNFIVREVEDPACEILAFAFVRKQLSYKDLDGFIENYGIPWIFLVMPPGLTPDQQAEWQAVADQIVGDGRGTLPHGSDIKTADAAARNVSPFTDFLKRHDEDIVLTATGGLLTVLTQAGSGTLAGGAHTDAWDEIVAGTADAISEELQVQFDKPLLAAAFPGQPVLARFRLALPEQTEDRGTVAQAVATLAAAGYRATPEWVMEMTGIEVEVATHVPRKPNEIYPPEGGSVFNRKGADEDPGGDGILRPSNAPGLEAVTREALADALQVTEDYLEPLAPIYRKLMEKMRDGSVTRGEFEAFAEELISSLPEVLDELDTDALAGSIETAMKSALAGSAETVLTGKLGNRHKRPRNARRG